METAENPRQVLDRLDAVLDDVLGLSLATMSQSDLAAYTCQLLSVTNTKFAAARTAAITASDQGLVAAVHGSKSTKDFLATEANLDARTVGFEVRLSRWLTDFGLFREAYETGVMLPGHLEQLRKADSGRTHFAMIQQQQIFIDAARNCDYRDYSDVIEYWLNANDPDGAKPREQVAQTKFTVKPNGDGSVNLSGYLDPLAAKAFATALDFEDQKLFRKDTAEENARGVGRRKADALMNLVVRGHRREDGSFPIPLINIVMGGEVVEDTLARIAQPSAEPLPVQWDNIDRRCEFIDGTPVHPHFALAALAVGQMRRQIINAEGRSIDVSVDTRLFPAWMKQALLVEARGKCQSRRCDAPFAWLQTDHINPTSRGGPTKVGNGQPLCGPHNLHKQDKPPTAVT